MTAITDHRVAADEPAVTGNTPLSPWPTTAIGHAAAIVRLKEQIEGRAAYSDESAEALGRAAAAIVNEYAPGAPQAVKDEACIRLAGYWAQSDFGGVESETSVGDKKASYFRPPPSAFRYSGAMGMLTRWKVRRAGVIA